MKKTLIAAVFLLAFAATGAGQGTCLRYLETGAGFSLCPPEGWTIAEKAGEKYKFMFGTAGNRFRPNINVKEQTSTATLAEYVELAQKLILSKDNIEKLGATSMEAVSKSEFATTSGLTGIKAEFQTVFKDLVIRTVQYYFELQGGRKVIVTFTGLGGDKQTLDPIIDRSLKTFRIEN